LWIDLWGLLDACACALDCGGGGCDVGDWDFVGGEGYAAEGSGKLRTGASARFTVHFEFIELTQGRNMKKFKLSASIVTLFAAGIFAGCSGMASKSPDVSDAIRKSLDQSGLKDVTVSQDRDKGVVTLEGKVTADADKVQAETIAKSLAGTQVVADQIAVLPPGAEKETKAVNADLDDGIEKNLDAALILNRMHESVHYDVKAGVVTLSGEVNSESKRAHAEKVAAAVPNVLQVVNDLQVKDQKASSSL
jgi:hyperosmotically inducible periplasmic protein